MEQEIIKLTKVLGQVVNRLDRIAEALTEKGGKKIPPYNPPIRKDPKRKPHPACARAREEAEADRLFAEFWDAYPKSCPRKVGKSKCKAKYAALMDRSENPAALHAEILAGLKRWSSSQDWVEDDGKFIKMPLAWLNQENWKDSPSPYSPRSTATAVERAADERERRAKEVWHDDPNGSEAHPKARARGGKYVPNHLPEPLLPPCS